MNTWSNMSLRNLYLGVQLGSLITPIPWVIGLGPMISPLYPHKTPLVLDVLVVNSPHFFQLRARRDCLCRKPLIW